MDIHPPVYIFSGLGADERVFQKLDFSGLPVHHVRWLQPKPGEPLPDYARRLAAPLTGTKPILIGLSFGGLVATEVAKQIETSGLILIASCKTRQEIPFYYRWAGALGLHKLLPVKLLKQANMVSNWFFGANTDFDKQVLKAILEDTDPVFLTWAIDQLVHWQNQQLLPNTIHIHGTADRVIPVWSVSCEYRIENGGHFMTLNKAEELTALLQQKIADLRGL